MRRWRTTVHENGFQLGRKSARSVPAVGFLLVALIPLFS